MKNRKRIILLLCLCFLLVCVLCPPIHADVGGGVDWDAKDWGGGQDFDSWGSTANGSIDPFLFLWLFRSLPLPVVIAIIAFGAIAMARNKRQQTRSSSRVSSAPPPAEAKEENLDQLLALDPHFSKDAFLSRASTIFITLQKAWQEKDWKSIRAFEGDSLYYQHEQQLNAFIEKGQTNKVEDIAILSTEIEDFHEDADNQYLNVLLIARYRDYVIEDASEKVVKGNPKTRYRMTYRMTFFRKKSARTEAQTDARVTDCPNCGAPLSIEQNGVCSYCGSSISTGAYQWVLSALTPLAQQTL